MPRTDQDRGEGRSPRQTGQSPTVEGPEPGSEAHDAIVEEAQQQAQQNQDGREQ